MDIKGKPLLDLFVFELKNGYAKHTILNILDAANQKNEQQWEQWINKIDAEAYPTGKLWVIVHKRKGRHPVVCMRKVHYNILTSSGCIEDSYPYAEFRIKGNCYFVCRSDDFFLNLDPKFVKKLAESHGETKKPKAKRKNKPIRKRT